MVMVAFLTGIGFIGMLIAFYGKFKGHFIHGIILSLGGVLAGVGLLPSSDYPNGNNTMVFIGALMIIIEIIVFIKKFCDSVNLEVARRMEAQKKQREQLALQIYRKPKNMKKLEEIASLYGINDANVAKELYNMGKQLETEKNQKEKNAIVQKSRNQEFKQYENEKK